MNTRDRGGPEQPMLTARDLRKYFALRGPLGTVNAHVQVVDGVSFDVRKGETLGPARRVETAALSGDPPNPVRPPSGCRATIFVTHDIGVACEVADRIARNVRCVSPIIMSEAEI